MSQVNFQSIIRIETNSLQQFHQACLEISHRLTARSVVALMGELGAGKTELVKCIAQSRGFQGMASPTFAIHHRYQGVSISIDHLDLYRLENEDELEGVGFWDFFSEKEGLIFIEWPERMNLSHIPWDWDLYQVRIYKIEGDPGLEQSFRALEFLKRIQI